MSAAIPPSGDVINRNLFLVRRPVGLFNLFKVARNFDVYDPETNQLIMECREENRGFFARLFRFNIRVRTPEGAQVLRVERRFTLATCRFRIYDHNDELIGGFKQKFLSSPEVLDRAEQPVCTLKRRDWMGFDLRLVRGEEELARVTIVFASLSDERIARDDYVKRWAAFAKELIWSGHKYLLSISPAVPPGSALRRLLLAAVVCIDFLIRRRSSGG